ncbi:MAG: GNVR domain-containing protein [Candidatus Edwardsbacteria bacterium]
MEEKKVSIHTYISVLIKRRKLILLNCAIVTFFALILSLVLPKYYKATAILLPPVEESTDILAFSSFLQGGGTFSSLGRKAGLPGMTTPSDIFAAILKSRTIMEGVVKECDLIKVYKLKKLEGKNLLLAMERTIRILSGFTEIEVSSEGLISVNVVAKEPELSAEIANAYISELDYFNREINMTRGKRTREFIEKRLKEEEIILKAMEDSLKKFQEKNRTVSLTDEMEAAIKSAADLKAQIMGFQVQLDVMRSYATEDNPRVMQLKRQIKEMEKQLAGMEFGDKKGKEFFTPFSKAPAIGMELARRMRDVKIHEEVFTLLTQQYEQAKIQEARDTPTVQILDHAIPPTKKYKPKRLFIVLGGFFLSLFSGIMFAFFSEYLDRVREDKEKYDEWKKIIEVLRHDFGSFKKNIFKHRSFTDETIIKTD